MPDDPDGRALTEAVLATLDHEGASPRTRELSGALVRHLHAFLREVRPSGEEWLAAIELLTRTGRLCTDTRQEFILLSDVLGVSMLVDTLNQRADGGSVTESTILGPFYVDDAPEVEHGADLAHGEAGEPMRVTGTVRDAGGAPIAGARVEVWQSDGEGVYDVQRDPGARSLRGRLRTDDQGRFAFRSVVPSSYPVPTDGTVGEVLRAQDRHPYRPAHVHFLVDAPGYERLVTHLFVDGDPYLGSDVVFGVRSSLVRTLERTGEDGAVLRCAFVLAAEPAPAR